ncbi:MAG: hypothetical protein CBD47_02610 [Synechococcus sp. TMED187]|uniref:GIVxVP protein n=1 Tax=unclassified Synechococcus TaxID=2626047 RepID=UPI000B721B8C|nr:GIVxVP protein [Synechococcus sp. UW105]MAS28609.1 hypothetical protein [Synechococcus sp. NAT40]OUW48763.1 MAG: hypothetical protein CBD47_02610 [Synechococcus sp. TMED187]RZO14903.1 MAG: hypothetical protein EVB08_01690 [Synechococcus sp. MED-G135]
MSRNRVASGVVMVPCIVLGVAFLCTAIWNDAAEANRPLAVGLGLLLPAVGLLAYLIPDSDPVTKTDGHDSSP